MTDSKIFRVFAWFLLQPVKVKRKTLNQFPVSKIYKKVIRNENKTWARWSRTEQIKLRACREDGEKTNIFSQPPIERSTISSPVDWTFDLPHFSIQRFAYFLIKNSSFPFVVELFCIFHKSKELDFDPAIHKLDWTTGDCFDVLFLFIDMIWEKKCKRDWRLKAFLTTATNILKFCCGCRWGRQIKFSHFLKIITKKLLFSTIPLLLSIFPFNL